MKFKLLFALLSLTATALSLSARYVISTNPTNNITTISFTNYFFEGVCTLEGREGRHWVPLENFYTTQRVGQVMTVLPTNYSQFRFKCVDVSPGDSFGRLAQVYGTIHTLAGLGVPPASNAWLPEYEGALATDVFLSDPRAVVADGAGNVYVVERGSHAVDKITPDGRIHTFVGLPSRIGTNLNNPIPQFGTNFALHSPSALYIAGETLFILDAGNNRLVGADLASSLSSELKVDLTPGGMGPEAEGLWVGLANDLSVDEAFYGSGTTLKHLNNGVIGIEATGFIHISDVKVNSLGRTIVADSGDNRIYRARGSGAKEVLAGTGFRVGPTSGKAKKTAMAGASSIAFPPIGGYFVALDEGARIYYVDAEDQTAPIAFGAPGVHQGDGEWFRAHGRQPKFSNLLNITLAPNGDLIFVEREGIIRKIDFLRHRP